MSDCAMDMPSGFLTVICGCMFAGKTGRLIDRLLAARAGNVPVAAFKHRADTRYDATRLRTHNARSFAAEPLADANRIVSAAGNAQLIGIDEAHFFGPGLVEAVQTLRAAGRDVIVAGLAHDAWGQTFPHMAALRELADELETLTTACTICGAPAHLSQRVVPLCDDNLVGGPGEYEPRCAAHFTPLPAPAPQYEPLPCVPPNRP